MQAGHNDRLTMAASPEPFALIVGRPLHDTAAAESAFRRMGLNPEPWASETIDARIAAPRFRLRFAALSVLAGCASDDAIALADPLHPSTSLLDASLPSDWRTEGRCWLFVPEDGGDGSSGDPVRMREFVKTMVLLIDLFDASHIFWSPAQLWSDAPQFRGAIAEMLASGMPPVLHLVAFRRGETGTGAVVRTRGLALFGGQEIEGRVPDGWTVAEMVTRLARLSLDIILNGPVSEPQRLRGLEPGEWMALSPEPGGTAGSSTVLVEFGSNF